MVLKSGIAQFLLMTTLVADLKSVIINLWVGPCFYRGNSLLNFSKSGITQFLLMAVIDLKNVIINLWMIPVFTIEIAF